MLTARTRRDRGLTSIGLVVRMVLVVSIIGLLMSWGGSTRAGTGFKAAVCRVLQRDDCGGVVSAGGHPAAGPPKPVVRPGARPGGGPKGLEPLQDLVDTLERSLEGALKDMEETVESVLE